MKKKNKGLAKEKKLKSKKKIGDLFLSGKSINKFPIRLVFSIENKKSGINFQSAFFVSKRNFKRAVDRNRIKRLLREAFRLQQNKIPENYFFNLIWIYTGKKMPDYHIIYKIIEEIIMELNNSSDGTA